jgi:hypothetical protein
MNLRKLLFSMALAVSTSVAFGQNFTIGIFNYFVNKDETTCIVRAASSQNISGHIEIPPTVTYDGKTYTVTGFTIDAFRGYNGITSVTIPNTIETIGQRAFFQCFNLTSVTIPESVKIIEEWAFKTCGLTSVTIPNSVTTIKERAFDNCFNLTDVTLGNSLETIGDNAFADSYNLPSIFIPGSVKTIVGSAFYGCSSLSTVTFSTLCSITSLESSVFGACTSLISITIPNSVTTIGSRAFDRCDALPAITIPKSVKTIDNRAFASCGSLTSVTFENGSSLITIDGAFYWCSSLSSITIPNSVTEIGYMAFGNCTGLTNVTVSWVNPLPLPLYTDSYGNKFYRFPDKISKETTLHVPCGTKNRYQAADVWKDFAVISDNCGSVKPGDINGDGAVNMMDLSPLLANFGRSGAAIANPAADLNGDNVVNMMDMSILLANFGM